MNHVMISSEGVKKPSWASKAVSFCEKVLSKLSLDNWELSVVFCTNDFIRDLNKRFRGIDEPTDILSFSQVEGSDFPDVNGGRSVIGDMIISLDMLQETSKEVSIPPQEELKRLLIHGILHLSGQDHNSTDSQEPMLIYQEQIFNDLREEIIF